MDRTLQKLLEEWAGYFSIKLDETQMCKFMRYGSILKEWNEKINLTAIDQDMDIVIKHFLDSLSIAPYIGTDESVIDIGTGAGFPGVPFF